RPSRRKSEEQVISKPCWRAAERISSIARTSSWVSLDPLTLPLGSPRRPGRDGASVALAATPNGATTSRAEATTLSARPGFVHPLLAAVPCLPVHCCDCQPG